MRERYLAVLTLIALAVTMASGAAGQVQPTLIGILEDNPGHYAGDPHYRDVRVVFRQERGIWLAFPSQCPDQQCLRTITAQFPAKVKWTVTFNGKGVGRVMSRTPPSFDFYATVGQQSIVGSTAPPTIGKLSSHFGGFLGQPVYRPLVSVSEPNYRDPDDWKRTQLSSDDTSAIRNAFRNRFPQVENCSQREIEQGKPWRYVDANMAVHKAYSSNRHWFLAEVVLSGYKCDGPPDEAFTPQWFVITPKHQVRFLDSNMWLVDAGDYDNDGKSELIFSIDGYDQGGYELFYDDFSRHATFEFGYH